MSKDYGMAEALKSLGIESNNLGTSTGSHFFGSGKSIDQGKGTHLIFLLNLSTCNRWEKTGHDENPQKFVHQ